MPWRRWGLLSCFDKDGPIRIQKDHPNIQNVIVKDLTDHGDNIRAGMSTVEQILAVPSLGVDFGKQKEDGHFYYSGENDEGATRRRNLATWLKQHGLK
jgi:hypothetical protein